MNHDRLAALTISLSEHRPHEGLPELPLASTQLSMQACLHRQARRDMQARAWLILQTCIRCAPAFHQLTNTQTCVLLADLRIAGMEAMAWAIACMLAAQACTL
eukprot:1138464-Pelagomonas_calceolata.AAC.1